MRVYSQDIGMECGIEKCALLIMRSRKWQMMERIELPNQEKNQNPRRKGTRHYQASRDEGEDFTRVAQQNEKTTWL